MKEQMLELTAKIRKEFDSSLEKLYEKDSIWISGEGGEGGEMISLFKLIRGVRNGSR
jgi:hypothetical protein